MGPEDRARERIDAILEAGGWCVQDYKDLNLAAGPGIAVRGFPLKSGHGAVDYVLFVDAQAIGVVEAKAVAQPSLSMGSVRQIPVAIPPRKEQNQIVSIIEAREGAVGKQLQRSTRLRQSILKRAFESKLVQQDSSDEPAAKLLARIKVERDAMEEIEAKSRPSHGRRKPQRKRVKKKTDSNLREGHHG